MKAKKFFTKRLHDSSAGAYQIVGKTISGVVLDFPGPSITLSFTDGTSFEVLNDSRRLMRLAYFYGPKDGQQVQQTVEGDGSA